MHTTELYFESHVTIEPVFGDRLSELKCIATQQGFRVADLIMKKGVGETPTPNQEDTFCTGRSKDWNTMKGKTYLFVTILQECGFKVYRYKIENTLLDSRVEDTDKLLDATNGVVR